MNTSCWLTWTVWVQNLPEELFPLGSLVTQETFLFTVDKKVEEGRLSLSLNRRQRREVILFKTCKRLINW